MQVITREEYKRNEQFNRHSRNALRVVQSFGTKAELNLIEEINWTHATNGSITLKDQEIRDSIVNKYYTKMVNTWEKAVN
tara:strand:+ start:5182 stop:5421 length:240 start_codon:yes stop_codon:yes gene_type:complete